MTSDTHRDDNGDKDLEAHADEAMNAPLDPDADAADQLDQRRPTAPEAARDQVDTSAEVPEADAIDQAISVPLDADGDEQSAPDV